MSTFGEILKKLRLEKNLTLDELAKIFESTKATLSRYENNKRTPNIEFANKAAKFFNVTTDFILGLSTSKNLDLPRTNENQFGVLQTSSDDISIEKAKKIIEFVKSLDLEES